jgi:hypothetical protein
MRKGTEVESPNLCYLREEIWVPRTNGRAAWLLAAAELIAAKWTGFAMDAAALPFEGADGAIKRS